MNLYTPTRPSPPFFPGEKTPEKKEEEETPIDRSVQNVLLEHLQCPLPEHVHPGLEPPHPLPYATTTPLATQPRNPEHPTLPSASAQSSSEDHQAAVQRTQARVNPRSFAGERRGTRMRPHARRGKEQELRG